MLRTLACALLAGCLAACGGTAPAPPTATSAAGGPAGVAVSVTADWGAEAIGGGDAPPGSAIDATAAVAAMETAYGGRYVAGLEGRAGDGERDWLFWLNGVESDVGAAEIDVAAGDALWWDLHRWDGRLHVPAVVGSWPAPIARGLRGAPPASADAPLAGALADLGVDVASPAGTTGPRALVGADDELRSRDADWARAAGDPAAWGLLAWIEGERILVWDAEAGAAVPVPEAVAVMTATTADATAGGDPLVVVAGLTDAHADAAATRIAADPALPRGHAAVCLDAAGRIVCSGGRGVVG